MNRSIRHDADRDEPTLAAIATADPFDRRTFSGYSAALFTALAERGRRITPIASRRIRARDVLDGALNLHGIVRGRVRGRRSPLIDPNWSYAPDVLERMARRVDTRIAEISTITHALQIGTHVVIDRPGVTTGCVTDCTVTQAVEAGEFAVSHASDTTVAHAIDHQRRVFEACDVVFTTSRWTATSIIDDYDQDANRIRVIGAGATNVGTPTPNAVDGRSTDGAPTVLFVGYDWELKGGPLLLDAWHTATARIPDARLVVIGCAPEIGDDRVDVVGRLDPSVPSERARLIDAYAHATCLALTSDFDAYPNVVLEAAAMGVPTVAFDEQSRAEVIDHGRTGLLVDTHTADAVAAALTTLLTDPAAARTMGAAARVRAEADATWDRVAARVEEALWPTDDTPTAKAHRHERIVS